MSVDFADLARVTAGHDWDKEVHYRAEWDDPWQRTYGVHAGLLIVNYGYGWLKYPAGGRDEYHHVKEIELDFMRMRRLVDRVRARDFASSSEKLKNGSALGVSTGVLRDVNPRLVFGIREIVSGSRDGQDAWYFSVSL